MKSKRKATQEEQYKDQAALDEAEELRMKENKEFHGTETDLLEAIDATKNVIIVLSKHNLELAQIKSVVRMLPPARVPQLILKSGSFNNINAQHLSCRGLLDWVVRATSPKVDRSLESSNK